MVTYSGTTDDTMVHAWLAMNGTMVQQMILLCMYD